MTKEQSVAVKKNIDEFTNKNYPMTFLSKSGKLHITIGTYLSGYEEEEKAFISCKESERNAIIDYLQEIFPQYKVEKNNKRYQGFINNICITVE